MEAEINRKIEKEESKKLMTSSESPDVTKLDDEADDSEYQIEFTHKVSNGSDN